VNDKDKKKEMDEDCFSCRLIGSGAFLGVSGYLLLQRQSVHVRDKKYRAALAVASATFGVLGVYRWRM